MKTFIYAPKITLITAVLNEVNSIQNTITSILEQTYNNIEFIIIDGGSIDGTKEILENNCNGITWISESDHGIYDAWNKGIGFATGEWIIFLGCGDTLYKDSIEKYVIHLNNLNSTDIDLITSKINLTFDNKIIRVIGKKWDWDTFKRYNSIAHVGALHSIKLFTKFGLFDINYKIAGDYEFLLRLNSKLKSSFINEVIGNMPLGGVSNKFSLRLYKEIYLAKTKTGNRIKTSAYLETIIAIMKFYFRNYFLN